MLRILLLTLCWEMCAVVSVVAAEPLVLRTGEAPVLWPHVEVWEPANPDSRLTDAQWAHVEGQFRPLAQPTLPLRPDRPVWLRWSVLSRQQEQQGVLTLGLSLPQSAQLYGPGQAEPLSRGLRHASTDFTQISPELNFQLTAPANPSPQTYYLRLESQSWLVLSPEWLTTPEFIQRLFERALWILCAVGVLVGGTFFLLFYRRQARLWLYGLRVTFLGVAIVAFLSFYGGVGLVPVAWQPLVLNVGTLMLVTMGQLTQAAIYDMRARRPRWFRGSLLLLGGLWGTTLFWLLRPLPGLLNLHVGLSFIAYAHNLALCVSHLREKPKISRFNLPFTLLPLSFCSLLLLSQLNVLPSFANVATLFYPIAVVIGMQWVSLTVMRLGEQQLLRFEIAAQQTVIAQRARARLQENLFANVRPELRQLGYAGQAQLQLHQHSPAVPAHRVTSVVKQLQRVTRSLEHLNWVALEMDKPLPSRVCSFTAVLAEPWQMAQDQLKEHQTLEAQLPPILPLIEVPPMLLKWVLHELLDNAVRHTQAGRIVLTASAREGKVHVQLRDSGSGLPFQWHPPEDFYFSASAETGRLGLGLTTSALLLQRIGARLEVDSRPDGVELRFVLSMANSQTLPTTAPQAQDRPQAWVLCEQQQLLTSAFETNPAFQLSWRSFASASSLLDELDAQSQPPFALVVEQRLPETPALLQALRRRAMKQNLTLLQLGGSAEAWVTELLPQPLDNFRLHATLRQCWERHQLWQGQSVEQQDLRDVRRRLLVELLQDSLRIWQEATGTDKFALLEACRLWKIYVHVQQGIVRARTFEAYLDLKTIPEVPRWRQVANTALFVAKRCAQHPDSGALAARTQDIIQHF